MVEGLGFRVEGLGFRVMEKWEMKWELGLCRSL